MDVGGGIDREAVTAARPGRTARPDDEEIAAAAGSGVAQRTQHGESLERVLLADGRRAILKVGGFWRSPVERHLYQLTLDPGVHGSPVLLAIGAGWLLLEAIDGRPVDLDDADDVRLVFRRLADIHAAPAPDDVPETPLSARDLRPLLALVERAARDPQAWEITPAVQALVVSLAARPDFPPAGPGSLLHGDYQRGNWLIDADGTARILDWELATSGPGIRDLYYLQPSGPGAGHAPARAMANRAVGWYRERLAELGAEPRPTADLLARLPDAIAWGTLAAAWLRLEDYYAEAPRTRSSRGQLPAAAARLIRYAAAAVGA